MTKEFAKLEKEAKRIEKDILTARKIIQGGMQRYQKKKLKARSKKVAEDMAVRFKDLANYKSFADIQGEFEADAITLKEYDRLSELWEMREKYVDENGKFHDRVTEILQDASYACGNRYREILNDYEERRFQEGAAE